MSDTIRVMGRYPSVPAGKYASIIINQLQVPKGYGGNYVDALADALVKACSNRQQALEVAIDSLLYAWGEGIENTGTLGFQLVKALGGSVDPAFMIHCISVDGLRHDEYEVLAQCLPPRSECPVNQLAHAVLTLDLHPCARTCPHCHHHSPAPNGQ